MMSTDVPLVSIIIVNWNGMAHLKDCLKSLIGQTFRNFEIILVDNGSTDGSGSFIKSNFPDVVLVELDKNTGFAHGNNVGLHHSSGEYIVTLNNDTIVDKYWLSELVRVANESPEIGIVGSRICSYENHDRIDSLGMLICSDGMSRGAYRNRKFLELSMKEDFDILFPSACAALYKRTMINKVGFFDEDFFAYCEDTDLGLRARRYGWQAKLAINAVVYHKYSKSGGVFSPFKLYHVERNHFWVVFKNFPARSILEFPFWSICRYALQVKLSVKSKGSGRELRENTNIVELFGALLKGIFAGVLGLRRNWKKRRNLMAEGRISDKEFSMLLQKYHLSFQELLNNAG